MTDSRLEQAKQWVCMTNCDCCQHRLALLDLIAELEREVEQQAERAVYRKEAERRALTRAEQAEARIAELERERDELRQELDGTNPYAADPREWGLRAMVEGLGKQVEHHTARAERAEAEVARLRGAITKHARATNILGEDICEFCGESWGSGKQGCICAALAGQGDGDGRCSDIMGGL